VQTNRFEVSGYLATHPVLRTLPSGTSVANVRLAQTYLSESNEGRGKQTNWFNLVFYGALAKVAVEYNKGDNINVVGSIQQRQFTPKDGSTRTVHEVVVQTCHRIAVPRDAVTLSEPNAGGSHELKNEKLSLPEQNDAWTVL
jgi:single-strand DNA-binding protein